MRTGMIRGLVLMVFFQGWISAKGNIAFSNAESFDHFRTIKLRYSMLVCFQL